jgi:hypothetical protein
MVLLYLVLLGLSTESFFFYFVSSRLLGLSLAFFKHSIREQKKSQKINDVIFGREFGRIDAAIGF